MHYPIYFNTLLIFVLFKILNIYNWIFVDNVEEVYFKKFLLCLLMRMCWRNHIMYDHTEENFLRKL